MTVSVIITCYNLERFIEEAIESVLNQTVKASEIIVVDDGSTDRSAEHILKFGSQVKLIKMPGNSGVLPAFMAGVKVATSDILSFLDGDDIWMPDKLEKVLQKFEENENVMMVTHLHQWIDEKGSITNTIDSTHENCQRIDTASKDIIERDALIKNSILCYKGVWLGSAFSIRKSMLDLEDYEKWAYSLPGKELSHQDQPLAAYLIYKNPDKLIVLINKFLFKYRVYPTNSSGITVNVQSALYSLRRALATSIRTKNIVEKRLDLKEENHMQAMQLMQYEFYIDLYQNKKAKAFAKYIKLFSGFWNGKRRIKETKRLFSCFVLGPSKFLEIKTKRRFS